MIPKKFNSKLNSLLNLFDSEQDFLNFLIEKKAFKESFIEEIIYSKNLKKFKDDQKIDLNEIKKNLHYEIGYNNDKKQISVDITKNDVFSYYDTDEELKLKMKNYIKNEDYERAQVLKNYFMTIEL
jgi:putative lipase involved disintegration of autophagic bodies